MANDPISQRPTKGRNHEHEKLINEILIKYGATPKLRLFKMSTGRINLGNRWFKAGFRGCSDLIGITSAGKFVACEVKTGTGRLTKDQKAFKRLCELFNAHYLLCRRIEDFERFFHKITTDCPHPTNNLFEK